MSGETEAFVKALAQSMAQEFGLTLTDALAKVRGVVNRPPRKPSTWPKQEIPAQIPPGMAVICGRGRNKKYRIVPAYHVLQIGKGGWVNNPEGDGSEEHRLSCGALWDSIADGQTVVVQLTPYQDRRADGLPIVCDHRGRPGYCEYPVGGFEHYKGTYYNPDFGLQYLERAREKKEAVNA